MQADSSVVEFLPSLAAKTRFSAEQVMHESDLPTISDDARKRLQSWGMSDAHILDLRVMMAPLSYTHCREKVAAIKNAYTSIDDNDVTTIKIPHFFDFMGRGDGQCVDLTNNLLFQLGVSDFFHNKGLKIDTHYAFGLSKLFFNEDGNRHYWLEIMQGGVDTMQNRMSVIIDPSFRLIQTQEESGYKPEEITLRPQKITSLTTATLHPTNFELTDSNWTLNNPFDTVVLGLTMSGRLSVSLGFYFHDDRLLPYLYLVDSDRNHKGVAFFLPPKGDFTTNLVDFQFTDPEKDEILAILRTVDNIRFHDQSEAPYDLDASSTRSW